MCKPSPQPRTPTPHPNPAQVRCVWVNNANMELLGAASPEAAMQDVTAATNRNIALQRVIVGLLKGIEQDGDGAPIKTWSTCVAAPLPACPGACLPAPEPHK
jgi:hypothetical protein